MLAMRWVRDQTSSSDDVTDEPEIYDGAHGCLQIVGRRLQEEKMLAVAEYIGGLIGK